MQNAIDELRSALLNRQKAAVPAKQGPAGPAGQAHASQPLHALQTVAGQMTGFSSPSTGTPDAGTNAPAAKAQPTLLSGLKSALAGVGSSGAGAPKTGMNPPTWPGTPAPMGPGEIPVGLPNNAAKVPPRWKRFETGQNMTDSLQQDGWGPNAMMIRILQGGR